MSSFVTSVLGFVDAAAVEVDSATGLPSGVAGLLRHIHIQFGDLRSDDVDLVVAALERRINDVKAQTEDILLAHEDECQSLLASALAQEQDTRDRIVDLKTRVNHVQHPVTGLLHVRKSELEQEKEAQRAAEREERLTRIHSEVNAFTESAEACKLILTEFGDLVDAVDTLNDLEISLEGIVDCEEVIPRSSLEDVFENVKTMIVQRVEDAFSNVFVIQPQEGSVTITTRSAVRVSNPEIPAQPIFIQTESLLKVIKTLNIHIPLYSNLSRSLMKSVLKPVILNPGCTLIISDEKLRDQDEINIGKLNIRFESNQNTSAGISDGLTKLTTIFQFISQNFFSSTTPPPHDLVQSTWSNLASTIIDHLLTPLIPTTPETLKQFPTTVAKPCIEFEDAMEDLAWVPLANENWRHLKGYCGSVETHYCVARWEMFMEKGREAMLKEDFETVVIGGITEKFDISDLETFLKAHTKPPTVKAKEMPLLYPPGSTGAELLEGLLVFPRCSISRRTHQVVKLLDEIIEEGTAEGVSPYCASRFYLLTRDLLTLHLTLTPIKHGQHLKKLPQASLIYHNDCLFLADHLIRTVGPTVRVGVSTKFGDKRLVLESEVSYIDLAAQFRNSGMEVFNNQLMAQKTHILELISSTNGLGMGDDARALEVQKMLSQVMYSTRQVISVWAPPMSPVAFHKKLICALAGWIISAVTVEILSAIDIADEESHRLNEMMHKLERSCTLLFVGDSDEPSSTEYEEGQALLRRHVGVEFTKYRKLKEMMVMSFAGIMDLFRGGRGDGFLHDEEEGGLNEFSGEELCGLVRALFSDTPLRQKNLAEIREMRGM